MNKVETIWIVDDDEVYQYITKTYIEVENAADNIISFTNAQEAIDKLSAQNGTPVPDIILLDINMPGVDGWQFLDEYKKIKQDIPQNIHIFLVTSSVDDNDRRKANSYAEIEKYIEKPIDEKTLQNILQNI